MKVSVNDQPLFTLSDIQKKVIQNEIPLEIFDADMNRRLQWVLMHKYEECFKALKSEWDPKLKANGISMIPTDEDAYAELVFAQPNYKNRSMRDSSSTVAPDS